MKFASPEEENRNSMPDQNQKSNSAPIKIGELLVMAESISEADLNAATSTAGETGLPIGRVLVMSGFIADKELQAAIQAQSMIKDEQVDLALAVSALKAATKKEMSLEEALREEGWLANKGVRTAKLGELLRNAEIISQEQLEEALKTSQETGLPLGRILVLTQAVSNEILSAALTAQILIRDKKVSSEQALQGLRSSKMRRVSLEVSLTDHGFYKPPSRQSVKLGELFVLSGLVTETDLFGALEIGLTQEKAIGQVLVDCGYVSFDVLGSALKFQEMVINGTLTALQAAEALRQVATRSISMAQAVAELEMVREEAGEAVNLADFLKVAGIVTEDDITKAIESCARNSALIGRILLVSGYLNEQTLHAAARALFLMREGYLKMEQAVLALNHCQKNQVSFDDALDELGWVAPTRVSMPGDSTTEPG